MENQLIQKEPQPWCPKCGKKMSLRKPEPATPYPVYSPYWRCSDYPDCLGSRDILLDGRPDYSDDYIE